MTELKPGPAHRGVTKNFSEVAPAVVSFTISVLEGDPEELQSIANMLQDEGFHVEPYGSARAFLEKSCCELPGCVLVNRKLPDMDGIDFQQQLHDRGCHCPVVFISTGGGTVLECASVMKAGALDFLAEPIAREQLLDAIARAAAEDRKRRRQSRTLSLLATLSRRERQVVDALVEGLINKQVAGRLGITEKTVKVHRAHALAKMGTRSLVELVRMMISASILSA